MNNQQSQFKKGVYLSYLLILISNLSNFYITPLLIKNYGVSEYGVYMLVGAFVGYIAVLDFGLSNTIIKFISQYRISNNKKDEETFIFSTLIMYISISISVLLVGLFLYTKLDFFFGRSLKIHEFEILKMMFIILIFNLTFTLPMNLFAGIITAYEKFTFPKVINLIKIIIRLLLIILLVQFKFSIIYIVVIDTLLNVTYMTILFLYTRIILKIKIKKTELSIKKMKEIISYSFLIFISVLVDQLYWKIGHFLLGSLSSASNVAIYAVSMMVVQLYITFSTVFSGMLLPKITFMVTKKSKPEELLNLMIKVGRIQLIILSFILMAYGLFGKEIIAIWIGSGFNQAWEISLVIMVVLTVVLIQSTGILILQAKNLHGFRAFVYLGIAIVNTCISYILAPLYGIYGVAFGTLSSLVIGNLIIMNIYYYKKIELDIFIFFKSSFKGILISSFLVFGFNFFLGMIFEGSYILLFIKVFVYIITFSLVYYFKGLNISEKKLLKLEFGSLNKKILKGRLKI